MYFTHATPSLTPPLNIIISQLPSQRCHPTLPYKHRSSTSRQFFLILPASRGNRNSNQEHTSLEEKIKSLTYQQAPPHSVEVLPKPPHTQLSVAFSLKWDTAWHVTSLLAFSSSSRPHYSFHTSFLPELHRPINNQAVIGAGEVKPWWQRKPSSVCPQTKTL